MPATLQDVVIVFVTVSGLKDGQLVQETYANKIYAREMGGRMLSAPSRSPPPPASARCSTCWPRARCGRAASSARRRSPWRTSWPTASVASMPAQAAATPSAHGQHDRTLTVHARPGHRRARQPRLLEPPRRPPPALAGDARRVALADHRREIARIVHDDERRGKARRSTRRTRPSWSGARFRRRGAASWSACSAKSCAPPRPIWACWSRSRPARRCPRAWARSRR